MNSIEFSRIEDGNYEISNENDQRLFCIGTLLLDDALRECLKKMLRYAPDIGLDKAHECETDSYKIKISPDATYGLLIHFLDKSNPEGHLETDIKIETLLSLIDAWEEAVGVEPESILITRTQDTFNLKAQ